MIEIAKYRIELKVAKAGHSSAVRSLFCCSNQVTSCMSSAAKLDRNGREVRDRSLLLLLLLLLLGQTCLCGDEIGRTENPYFFLEKEKRSFAKQPFKKRN